MPTKLTQLRYSGYSAEFLDRVEPNGNIPGKNGTCIAGRQKKVEKMLKTFCHGKISTNKLSLKSVRRLKLAQLRLQLALPLKN